MNTIVDNINTLYPDASKNLKEKAADVVIRAVENLVYVKGGTFDMGDFKTNCNIPSKTFDRMDWSPDASCLASPASVANGAQHLHQVTLDSYSISKYMTSFGDMEWMHKINQLPVALYAFHEKRQVKRSDADYQDRVDYASDYPASTKSWQEAKDYCLWLGKISTIKFDLPTEAQWEYAARSRGKHVYYATNTGYRQVREGSYYNPKTQKYVEYNNNQVNASNHIEKIGVYPPNPLGLYDMTSVNKQWVNDWYSKNYYLHSPEKNPKGPKTGSEKVVRSGVAVRVFGRRGQDPQLKYHSVNYSFRCSAN
ncbi:formylglycine-generating enzyme family protein [Vibrio zhugei]|uniref:formylglycine-generating enzyme family protein n=1 Tax=Vibrio zhugei TaxID=2479546 RepID=UPI001F5447AD|nr:SUMF1/EgtB/PvdO family nonheme iron enzyme [Vibrio zhugei]